MQITGKLLYNCFHAATPLAGVFPSWEFLEDWERAIYDRYASLVLEELHKQERVATGDTGTDL